MFVKALAEADNESRYVLVFQAGDSLKEDLGHFVEQKGIEAAQFTAIGAFQGATLAYFDWEKKAYEDIPVEEQVEVASLTGNVAMAPDGHKRKIHIHCVLGMRDGTARAGHLRQAIVRPTLELFLVAPATRLHREPDSDTGLALLRPN